MTTVYILTAILGLPDRGGIGHRPLSHSRLLRSPWHAHNHSLSLSTASYCCYIGTSECGGDRYRPGDSQAAEPGSLSRWLLLPWTRAMQLQCMVYPTIATLTPSPLPEVFWLSWSAATFSTLFSVLRPSRHLRTPFAFSVSSKGVDAAVYSRYSPRRFDLENQILSQGCVRQLCGVYLPRNVRRLRDAPCPSPRDISV